MHVLIILFFPFYAIAQWLRLELKPCLPGDNFTTGFTRQGTSATKAHETVEEQEVRAGGSQGTSVLERLPATEENWGSSSSSCTARLWPAGWPWECREEFGSQLWLQGFSLYFYATHHYLSNFRSNPKSESFLQVDFEHNRLDNTQFKWLKFCP